MFRNSDTLHSKQLFEIADRVTIQLETPGERGVLFMKVIQFVLQGFDVLLLEDPVGSDELVQLHRGVLQLTVVHAVLEHVVWKWQVARQSFLRVLSVKPFLSFSRVTRSDILKLLRRNGYCVLTLHSL